MKAQFNRRELEKSIRVVRSAFPKLGAIAIRVENLEVSLESSSSHGYLRVPVDRAIADRDGVVICDAGLIANISKKMARDHLTIAEEDGAISISSDGYSFSILKKDGVAIEGREEFRIDRSVEPPRRSFAHMLRFVSFGAARDVRRRAINGVLFEIDDENVILTATDGKRLVTASLPVSNPEKNNMRGFVPLKSVKSLISLLKFGADSIRIAIMESSIQVDFGGSLFVVRVGSWFPEYRSAIPSFGITTVIVLERESFLAAVESAVLTNLGAVSVSLVAIDNGVLLVASSVKTVGTSAIEVPISSLDGKFRGALRFKPVCLIDALRTACNKCVRMEIYGPGRPVVISSGSVLWAIMPLEDELLTP